MLSSGLGHPPRHRRRDAFCESDNHRNVRHGGLTPNNPQILNLRVEKVVWNWYLPLAMGRHTLERGAKGRPFRFSDATKSLQ